MNSGEKIGGGKNSGKKNKTYSQTKIPIFILKLLFLHSVGNKKKEKKKEIQKFGNVMSIDIITGYTFGAGYIFGAHCTVCNFEDGGRIK